MAAVVQYGAGSSVGGSRPRAQLSRSVLLWIYAAVPVGIAIPLIDALFLTGRVRRSLPVDPAEVLLWTLIFNVPHLVASELILLDREYMHHYRRPLLLGAVLVASLTLASGYMLSGAWSLLILASVTTYHIVGQQIGITRMMGGRDPGRWLTAWKLLAVIVWLIAQFQAGLAAPELRSGGPLVWLAAVLCVPMSLCAWQVWSRVREPRARLYVLANQVMFLAFLPLAATGYVFFLILIPRVVHDLCAFAFYINHDTNRNQDAPRGLLYRLLGFTGLPPWFLLPAVSIGIAYWANVMDRGSVLHLIGVISFFHFFMEAVTWKHTGLHRRSVSLV